MTAENFGHEKGLGWDLKFVIVGVTITAAFFIGSIVLGNVAVPDAGFMTFLTAIVVAQLGLFRRVGGISGELKNYVKHVDYRFTEVDRRLNRIEDRLDRIDERFAKIDERFAKMDDRFSNIDERFAKLDARFAKMDGRFSELISEIAGMKPAFRQHLARPK